MKRFTIYIRSFGLCPIIHANIFELVIVFLCDFWKPFSFIVRTCIPFACNEHKIMFSPDYGPYLANVNDNFGLNGCLWCFVVCFQHRYMGTNCNLCIQIYLENDANLRNMFDVQCVCIHLDYVTGYGTTIEMIMVYFTKWFSELIIKYKILETTIVQLKPIFLYVLFNNSNIFEIKTTYFCRICWIYRQVREMKLRNVECKRDRWTIHLVCICGFNETHKSYGIRSLSLRWPLYCIWFRMCSCAWLDIFFNSIIAFSFKKRICMGFDDTLCCLSHLFIRICNGWEWANNRCLIILCKFFTNCSFWSRCQADKRA